MKQRSLQNYLPAAFACAVYRLQKRGFTCDRSAAAPDQHHPVAPYWVLDRQTQSAVNPVVALMEGKRRTANAYRDLATYLHLDVSAMTRFELRLHGVDTTIAHYYEEYLGLYFGQKLYGRSVTRAGYRGKNLWDDLEFPGNKFDFANYAVGNAAIFKPETV
jgi:hypothetical protein